MFVYAAVETTRSSFLAARPERLMRVPSLTTAASSGLPFREISCTSVVHASMKVEAPGSASNETSVSLRNVPPAPDRSRRTS